MNAFGYVPYRDDEPEPRLPRCSLCGCESEELEELPGEKACPACADILRRIEEEEAA